MKRSIKKLAILLLVFAVAFSAWACQSSDGEQEDSAAETTGQEQENDAGILTEDEQENIDLLADELIEITDEDYATTVSEMQYHLDQFSGQVYHMEGVYTTEHNGDTPYIYRTLVNGEEETFCGLPLVYVTKEIENGSWVSVTGIVNVHEINGESVNALEVLAIQTLDEQGEATLEWSGSEHAH